MPAVAEPIPALGGQTFRVYEGQRQGSKLAQGDLAESVLFPSALPQFRR